MYVSVGVATSTYLARRAYWLDEGACNYPSSCSNLVLYRVILVYYLLLVQPDLNLPV